MTKLFGSALKLPGSGEVNKCFYPLRLDTYGCGCEHDCLYCYAKSVLDFRGLWGEASVAYTGKIIRQMERALSGKGSSEIDTLIRRRVPVRLGGMTDCFQRETETRFGATKRVLQELNALRYPYLILTKSSLIEEYGALIDPELAYVQFSITTPHEDVAAVYEPGASTVADRFAALKTLSDAGVYTAVRINPLFPQWADGHLASGVESEPFRYYDDSLVGMCADAGVGTIIAGFVRLSAPNLRWIKEATGEDLRWLFDPEQKASNQALHFSAAEKAIYYERIKRLCDDAGMAFSVCYDGDDAYRTFHHLWADPLDCCNGRTNVPAFGSTYRAFHEEGK